ncbi:MAG: hypothetical protein A3E83_01535 [Gammaproteobacteria bacterium RIFCSPHIGHO2_12_FULL_41_20]|nr:MAG: hypothetical protein A3E83_01535 [Gammaproteobacteria bacterium RIFCSPHIGHO2_12_FULL_41_20]
MNIRDLKYLVALAEYRHFGKAAQACHVSQPGLSMQIKKLENILGLQLIERTNKLALLTEHGQTIAKQASSILNQVDEMFAFAQSVKDPFMGELRVGIIPTLAPYLLPHIMPPLIKAFPNVSFYLIEEQTAVLVEKLQHAKIHAAILAMPISESHFSSAILFEEEFLLAVPKQHAFTKHKTIKQLDLVGKNLLLLAEGHCLREQALALCEKMHATETHGFQATSLETLRHMVAAGVGMTLMPKLACKTTNRVSYIPFSAPKPKRTIGLYWRSGTAKQPLFVEIAKKLRSTMPEAFHF